MKTRLTVTHLDGEKEIINDYSGDFEFFGGYQGQMSQENEFIFFGNEKSSAFIVALRTDIKSVYETGYDQHKEKACGK